MKVILNESGLIFDCMSERINSYCENFRLTASLPLRVKYPLMTTN